MDLVLDDPQTNPSQTRVLGYIEATLTQIMEDIRVRPPRAPKISLNRITAVRSKPNMSASNEQLAIEYRPIEYSFPGKNKEEAWRFTCLGKILSEIYTAIKAGVVVTKRDIYYRDPDLYKSQGTVDRYVDDIAYTCKVTRKDLNVTASPRGLVAGLNIDCDMKISDVQIVPDTISRELLQIGLINWILVVEKEAMFKNLVENQFHQNLSHGCGLLVTGKGYPDLSTRRFLRACLEHRYRTTDLRSPPPVYGLFDCDPDGLSILKTYRLGSKSLPHEHAHNVSEMIWLGVRHADLMPQCSEDECLIRLTERDRARAVKMLEEGDIEHVSDAEYRHHTECRAPLQHMLLLNRKAEMQILDGHLGDLAIWLEQKFHERKGCAW